MPPRKKPEPKIALEVVVPSAPIEAPKKRGRPKKVAPAPPTPPEPEVHVVRGVLTAADLNIVPGPPPLRCTSKKDGCNRLGRNCAGIKRGSCPGWVCLNHTQEGKQDGPFARKIICGTCGERQYGSASNEHRGKKSDE